MKTIHNNNTNSSFSNKSNIIKKIPLKLKIQIIYKNFMFSFIFSLFLSTLIYFFFLIINADFHTISFYQTDPVTQAEIISIEKSKAKTFYGKIYKYNYKYSIDNKIYKGKSYLKEKLDLKTIDVLYKENNFEESCIVGMKTNTNSIITAIFYGLFLLVFIFLLIKILKIQLSKIKILKTGIITKAVFREKIKTNFKFKGNKYVYELFFDFVANDGKTYKAKTKTTDVQKLSDELYEPVIYNQQNPEEAVLIDEFPIVVRNFLLNNTDF